MARAWHLKAVRKGMPDMTNFELKELDLPPVAEGLIRVRNRWLSVDPYMRGRMNDVKSYDPPFALDAPMEGGAIGEVIESCAEGFAPGDLVQHMAGWRDEAVIQSRGAIKLPDLGARPSSSSECSGLPARRLISDCSTLPRPGRVTWCSSQRLPARLARSRCRSPRPGE